MITFSIITPINKLPLSFENCIDSLENQSYKNFEWILVLNGNNEKILKENLEIILERKKINYRLLTANDSSGPSFSRNFGINNSTSEYIVFLDADDFFDFQYLFYLNQRIIEIGKKKFCLASNGKRVWPDKNYHGKNNLIFNDRKLSRNEISLNFIGSITGFCLSRNINVMFDNNLRFFEDYFFYICCMKENISFYSCSNAIYYYFQSDQSSTQLARKHNQEIIFNSKNIILKKIKNLGISSFEQILLIIQLKRLEYFHRNYFFQGLLFSLILFFLNPRYAFLFFRRGIINYLQ